MEPIPASEWERYNRGALDMIVHKVSKFSMAQSLLREHLLGQWEDGPTTIGDRP